MRILYLDMPMGVAGDMLSAALYELLDDEDKNIFIRTVNSLGLEGVKICAKPASKCGICGTHMEVTVDGIEEGDHDHHHHEDEHHHHHHHSSVNDIAGIIDGLNINEVVKENAKKVYSLIADAESLVHGVRIDEIHFHEVGTMDAVADVISVCILMDMLKPNKVTASPVCTGYGKVRCAHGILPVPAPATAHILKDIPVYSGDTEGELCTPTGAALIKYFADEFGHMSVMVPERSGYGMGTNDFETVNCVRAILGHSEGEDESVAILSCNVDDMTGEAIGYALSVFMEEGALDAYTTAIGMKKSRPGVMISVLCSPQDRERFVSLIFANTTTIGIRMSVSSRYVLKRRTESVNTSLGQIRVKTSEGYGITRSKYEFDDICRIAKEKGLSTDEVIRIIDGKRNDS